MDLDKLFIEHLLYPAMEWRKGNRTRQYINELKASQQLSPEELAKLQQEKLKKLLLHCARNVPAYKGLLNMEEIEADPVAALIKLPLTTKQRYRENPDSYLSDNIKKENLIPNITGGSTGIPIHFYMDRYTVEHYEAARWRGLSWHGITPGSRSIMIWSNPVELANHQQKSYARREKYLKNRIVIPAYSLDKTKALEYIKTLNSYQPEYFYGYVSAFYQFTQIIAPYKDQLKLKNLKACVLTSETIHQHQREFIGEVFGVPVVGEYGAHDAGILSYQCPCGGSHISAENCYLEVLDPITMEPVEPGKSGIIATTDLNNFSQPRLRYLLGDTITLSEELCSCGMPMPILKSIDGREDAMFLLPGGKLMHGDSVAHVAKVYPSIIQYQLIQHDKESATLKIVSTKEAPGEVQSCYADIKKLFDGINVELQEVDEIPPAASGKYRYAIREFPLA